MTIALHRWGSGPPVVFLHGLTMTGAVWAPVAQRIAAASLAPDLPGHGATRGHDASLDGGVALLRALVAAEGLSGATLVGWSLGAAIGWRYLAAGGAGFSRMVSVDMSPRPRPAPGWAFAMRGGGRFPLEAPGSALSVARALFAAPMGSEALPTEAAASLIAAQDPAAMRRMWDSLLGADLRDAITALPVPLLAIHGAQSRLYPPETALWLARSAPRGRALVMPGCGHSPHLENPVAFAAALADFLAT